MGRVTLLLVWIQGRNRRREASQIWKGSKPLKRSRGGYREAWSYENVHTREFAISREAVGKRGRKLMLRGEIGGCAFNRGGQW